MCLNAFPPFIRGLEIDSNRAEELLQKGHILATEIADELTREGLAFREAYKQVASLVGKAEERGCQVHELKVADFKAISPALSESFMSGLSFESAVEKRRQQSGGTSMKAFSAGSQSVERKINYERRLEKSKLTPTTNTKSADSAGRSALLAVICSIKKSLELTPAFVAIKKLV